MGASGEHGGVGTNAGAAYLFQRSSASWSQQGKLLPAGNMDSNDLFGFSAGISGKTILIGAVYEASNQTTITTTTNANNFASSSGAAYVFH